MSENNVTNTEEVLKDYDYGRNYYQYMGFSKKEDFDAYAADCIDGIDGYWYNKWMKTEDYTMENVELLKMNNEEEPKTDTVVMKRATYDDLLELHDYYMNNLQSIEIITETEEELEDVVIRNITFIFLTGCFYILRNSEGKIVGSFSAHLSTEIQGVKSTPVVKNIAYDVPYVKAIAEGLHTIIMNIKSGTKALAMYVIVLARRENELLNTIISEMFKAAPRSVREHPETFVYYCMFSNSKTLDKSGKNNNGTVVKILKNQSRSYDAMFAQRDADLKKHLPANVVKDLYKGNS